MRALLAVALLAAALLAGCSSGPATPPTPPMEDGKYVIRMTSAGSFQPKEASIPLNATVVFVNDGGVHDASARDGSWSSDDAPPRGLNRKMQPGERWEHTFTAAGTVPYECRIHASTGMVGTLHVG